MEQTNPKVPNRFPNPTPHRGLGCEPRGRAGAGANQRTGVPWKRTAPPLPYSWLLLENVSQHFQIFQSYRRSRKSGFLYETCQFLNVGK